MNPPDQPCQATPAGDLRQQIMDSRVPKNEREWWASREIEKLERELAAAKAECDLNRTRLASIFWSGAMDKFTGGDVQKWAADYTAELARLRAELAVAENWVEHHSKHADDLIGENVRLRAEVERLNAKLSSIEEDGTVEHNAAVGLRQNLVAAIARAERAELKLEKMATALADCISTFRSDDKTTIITVERQEAWRAALLSYKPDHTFT